jgi:2-iminobutanoate/2-iminopropanoate deaminase
MATIQKYCASGIDDPPGYRQAIKITGAQTKPAHRGDFKAQARAVFGAIKAHVEAGGGTLANVVKITTFVTDVRCRPELRELRDEFFGVRGPASTMIEVSALADPDYLIEIEALAIF